MRRHALRMLLLPALALVALTGLTGCGNDESGSSSPSSPASAADGTAAVEAAVTEVAPELESFYRGSPYPQTLDEAIASLPDAGVTLDPGLQVGGYTYDPDATEFVLCLEDASGAWASYDTAPMGVRDSGGEGGCPS